MARNRFRLVIIAATLAAMMALSIVAEARPTPTLAASATSETCGFDVAYEASWDTARVSTVLIAIVDTADASVVDSTNHRLAKPARSGTFSGSLPELGLDATGEYVLRATFMLKRGKRDILIGQVVEAIDVLCFEV